MRPPSNTMSPTLHRSCPVSEYYSKSTAACRVLNFTTSEAPQPPPLVKVPAPAPASAPTPAPVVVARGAPSPVGGEARAAFSTEGPSKRNKRVRINEDLNTVRTMTPSPLNDFMATVNKIHSSLKEKCPEAYSAMKAFFAPFYGRHSRSLGEREVAYLLTSYITLYNAQVTMRSETMRILAGPPTAAASTASEPSRA